MPIEIRELHIKLDLKDRTADQNTSAADGNTGPQADREELIAELEDWIANKLRDQKER